MHKPVVRTFVALPVVVTVLLALVICAACPKRVPYGGQGPGALPRREQHSTGLDIAWRTLVDTGAIAKAIKDGRADPVSGFKDYPAAGACGDFDGDGNQELLVAGGEADDHGLLYSADGSSRRVPFAGAVFGRSVAWDCDRDGRDEIVVDACRLELTAGARPTEPVYYPVCGIDGTELGWIQTALVAFCNTLPADLDGDGFKELVVYAALVADDASRNAVTAYRDLGPPVWSVKASISYFGVEELHAGDIDSDGRAEILVAEGSTPDVKAYGMGQQPVTLAGWPPDTFPTAISDLDGDGWCEIVAFPKGIYHPQTSRWTAFDIPPEFDLATKAACYVCDCTSLPGAPCPCPSPMRVFTAGCRTAVISAGRQDAPDIAVFQPAAGGFFLLFSAKGKCQAYQEPAAQTGQPTILRTSQGTYLVVNNDRGLFIYP